MGLEHCGGFAGKPECEKAAKLRSIRDCCIARPADRIGSLKMPSGPSALFSELWEKLSSSRTGLRDDATLFGRDAVSNPVNHLSRLIVQLTAGCGCVCQCATCSAKGPGSMQQL